MSSELLKDDGNYFNKLAWPVQSDLFGHYINLQLRIRLELDLLGIKVFGLDFSDDNYWLEFRFEGWPPLERFFELVEGAHYPSGADWYTEGCYDDVEDRGLALFIPRMDSHVVYRMLNRLTTLIVNDQQRLATIKEHERRRGGQEMEHWGR